MLDPFEEKSASIKARHARQNRLLTLFMIVMIVASVVSVLVYATVTRADALVHARNPVVIIDGDTIDIDHVRIRILKIDTPETFRSRCDNELVAGLAAKERLRQLLDSGAVSYEAEGFDKYRRTLARVYVDGRDVGEILIAEGFALPYEAGRIAKAKRLRFWCGVNVGQVQ